MLSSSQFLAEPDKLMEEIISKTQVILEEKTVVESEKEEFIKFLKILTLSAPLTRSDLLNFSIQSRYVACFMLLAPDNLYFQETDYLKVIQKHPLFIKVILEKEKIETPLKGQVWKIQLQQVLNLKPNLAGTCYGVAYEGVLAILDERPVHLIFLFSKMYRMIKSLHQQMNKLALEDINDPEAKRADLIQQEIASVQENFDLSESKSLLSNKQEKCCKKIHALCKRIASFQNITKVENPANLFEEKNKPRTQRDLLLMLPSIMPVLGPKKWERLQGIVKIEEGSFTANYRSRQELEMNIFTPLLEAVEEIKPTRPFSFLFVNDNHAVTLGYFPQLKKWFFVDANDSLPYFPRQKKIAKIVVNALKTGSSAFEVQLFVTSRTEHVLEAKSLCQHWRPREKRKQLSGDFSKWLEQAVESNDLEAVQWLLENKAVEERSPLQSSLLYRAAYYGYVEIVQELVKGQFVLKEREREVLTNMMINSGSCQLLKSLESVSAQFILTSEAISLNIFSAIQSGSLQALRTILELKPECFKVTAYRESFFLGMKKRLDDGNNFDFLVPFFKGPEPVPFSFLKMIYENRKSNDWLLYFIHLVRAGDNANEVETDQNDVLALLAKKNEWCLIKELLDLGLQPAQYRDQLWENLLVRSLWAALNQEADDLKPEQIEACFAVIDKIAKDASLIENGMINQLIILIKRIHEIKKDKSNFSQSECFEEGCKIIFKTLNKNKKLLTKEGINKIKYYIYAHQQTESPLHFLEEKSMHSLCQTSSQVINDNSFVLERKHEVVEGAADLTNVFGDREYEDYLVFFLQEEKKSLNEAIDSIVDEDVRAKFEIARDGILALPITSREELGLKVETLSKTRNFIRYPKENYKSYLKFIEDNFSEKPSPLWKAAGAAMFVAGILLGVFCGLSAASVIGSASAVGFGFGATVAFSLTATFFAKGYDSGLGGSVREAANQFVMIK